MAFRPLSALLLVSALSLTACSASTATWSPDDNADQQACATEDYEFEVQGESDLTRARIESLNSYAMRKLASRQCDVDNTLERRGQLVEGLPSMADVYRVEVGSEEQCLNGWYFFANYDLEKDGRYEGMKSQIDMAIEFLTRIHEDTGGLPTPLFDRITLCPQEFWGESMSLAGQTLYINPSFTQFGGVSTLDGRELRAGLWTPGEHLNSFSSSGAYKAVWPLLDPAGTIRSTLRSGVAERLRDLAAGLADALRSEEGDERQGGNLIGTLALLAEVREHVMDSEGADGEPSIQERALTLLSEATTKQVQCVTEEWKAYIEEPDAATTASEAGIATLYKEAARNQLNVNVKQSGVIVIGNTHFVNVNLDVFFSSGYEELERYVQVREVEQNIEWEQTGFLVIYTIDDINVNVNVNVNKTLQTAGIVSALRGCGLEF